MEKQYTALENTYAIQILINLPENKDRIKSKELMDKINCNSNVTFNNRLDELKKVGLLKYHLKPTIKDGVPVGGGKTKWIWLTTQGQNVARHLKEIKEMMERNDG